MRHRIGALLLVVAACGGVSDPAGYVAEYGGMESQYEVLVESIDCQHLGETAAEMDARYDRERDRVALGYQRAAVDRMVAIDCP